jgi:hypothetical protein
VDKGQSVGRARHAAFMLELHREHARYGEIASTPAKVKDQFERAAGKPKEIPTGTSVSEKQVGTPASVAGDLSRQFQSIAHLRGSQISPQNRLEAMRKGRRVAKIDRGPEAGR